MAKVSAKGRRQKGQRFERKVRDELKRIYDSDRRDQIHRVPMSGASYTKGDVVDLNDNSWSYEAKCQETLSLRPWWKQAKEQASPFQTPCLVFSSNNRPIYWVLKVSDWEAYESETIYDGRISYVEMSTRLLYDKLSLMPEMSVGKTKLGDDDVVIVPNELYISLRRELHNG